MSTSRIILRCMLTVSAGFALAACTNAGQHVVVNGDSVDFSFICRYPDKRIAVTTIKDRILEGELKSPVYLPRTGAEFETVVPGKADETTPSRMGKAFEQEVLDRLALMTVGHKAGDEINTDLKPGAANSDSKPVRLARVRKRAKEMTLSIDEYTNRKGQKPELGNSFIIDPLFPGQVTAVNEKTVVIRFAPLEKENLKSPFGPATVTDKGDDYEMDIDVTKGTLIRAGGLVGRITDVDKDSFTIDFSRDFGGEPLNCNMKIIDVKPTAKLIKTETSHQNVPAKTEPAIAGDLAMVDYSINLEDGTLVYTTMRSVAENPAIKKSQLFRPSAHYEPEAVNVGGIALFPGIGEAVAGLEPGQKKVVVIPPEKAFGQPDPHKMIIMSLERKLPMTFSMPVTEFSKRTGMSPVVGKEFDLVPYFPAKVSAIHDNSVDMAFQVVDGALFKDAFGQTVVRVSENEITTRLTPVVGGKFPLQHGEGTVVSFDDRQFTVDQNNPLAGKTITVEVALESLKPAAAIPSGEYKWKDNIDSALIAAKAAGKPAVLILHADWCGYCKKMFAETFPDPRIRELRDRFEWIRVDSDKQPEIKQKYAQEGFPMIVLYKADGSEAGRINGFVEAAGLNKVLRELL